MDRKYAQKEISEEVYEQKTQTIRKEWNKLIDAQINTEKFIENNPLLTSEEKQQLEDLQSYNLSVTSKITSEQIKNAKDRGNKLKEIVENLEKREEEIVSDFEEIISSFAKENKFRFLEVQIDTISKTVLDYKFAENILPDNQNDSTGEFLGEFKLSKEGSIQYIWEGDYWTKVIDNGDDTYSAIVFSRISNDVIETVTWHKEDELQTIAKKIKAGKDTANFIGKFVVVAPLMMDINPAFKAGKIATRVRLFKEIVKKQTKTLYEKAIEKYPKELENAKRLTIKQLEKAIKSHQKRIIEHLEYINNLTKRKQHVPNWENLSKKHQENLIHHWKKDIERHKSYMEIKKRILNEKQNIQ